jgi:phospholipid/cholesterol/gamma-HCH transport system substrate-binding protein
MPRTRSLAWSELKTGILTITAAVIAAVMIFSLTGGRGFSWQRYTLKTKFPNVAGLAKGSPVRVAGVEVGTVTGIGFTNEQVEVTFEVKKDQRERITDKSVAALGSISLLGESAVDITPVTTGTPIPEFGYVPAGRSKGSIADVSETATEGIEEVTQLLRDIRQGKGTVGKLMTDEQLYSELRRFASSANDLTDGLKAGKGSLGKFLNDPATADSLNASLKNVETLMRQLNEGQGSLGKLLKDDRFAESLSSVTGNIDALVAKINRGEGTAGKLITDTALYDRLTGVTDRLNQLITRLNDGEGTAGQLLKDRRLYENMNKVTMDLSGLLQEISKNPKKYLNVKVSIF